MKLRIIWFHRLFLMAFVGCAIVTSTAQGEKPVVATPATSKFGELPVLPSCATFAPQHGDPTKGAATILIKSTSGCVIPWHWHTAAEQLMFVSGTAKIEMEGSSAHTLNKGDFVLLPAKHHHQFTCTANCLFFNSIDDAFDIHYLDKAGNEIPPDQALKPSATATKKPVPKSKE
jgi:quercetin dioxygenase-like cupin family protein